MIINNLPFIFFFLISTTIASPSSPLNFTVYGTADVNRTSIILTHHHNNCLTPFSHHSDTTIGRVFYKTPIPFLNSFSFSTRFSFTLLPPPPPCPAVAVEGLAFLIASDPNNLPHSAGCMGLPKSDSSFFAVEFDTDFDQNLGDINDNHVAIDVNSVFSIASVDLKSIGVDLKSGKKITAWIEYRSSQKMIMIWVGYDKIRPESPVLVAPLDVFSFSKRVVNNNNNNGFVYVGFSGSNGRGFATYLIHNWRFFKTSESSSFPPNLEVETVEESADCLVCFPPDVSGGKDEQQQQQQGKRDHHHHHHSDVWMLELAYGLGFLNLILALLSLCLVSCIIKRRRNRAQQRETTVENEPRINSGDTRFHDEDRMPRRLKLSEIRSATKGFSRNQIACEGASAIVYEATLSGEESAVKRFVHANKTGSFEPQFVTEFVKMAGAFRHKNLVHLQGWCCEKKELILVHEFISNGPLDKILRRPTDDNDDPLSFDSRSKILLGVASALVYLHEECERPIVHRNVKTSNVLLDGDLVPKLGDSGIGELYDRNSRARDGTLQAGAIGYLAPEYVFSGVPTVKTDVYSFGVVVLEVVTGRGAVDEGGVAVTDWVWDLWEKKALVGGAVPRLMGRFNSKDMEMMLMVGLVCVHPNYEMRPIMKEVVNMLQGVLMPKLPASKPTVTIQSVTVDGSPAGCGGDDGGTS